MSVLFVSQDRKTQYLISDLYVMVLTFLLAYFLTVYSKKIIKKFNEYKKKKAIIKKGILSQGGQAELLEYDTTDSKALVRIIDECLKDDKTYLVLNGKIKKWITVLVQEKIRNQSLVLSPNFIKFISHYFLRKDRLVFGSVSTALIIIQNTPQFIMRFLAATIVGILAGINSSMVFGVFGILNIFLLTEQVPDCGKHFREIISHTESEIAVLVPTETNNLIISNEAEKIQLYIPSRDPIKEKVIREAPGVKTLETRQIYRKAKKKAKQVKFSDFKKIDPVLSKFNNLEEPELKHSSKLFKISRKVHEDALEDL